MSEQSPVTFEIEEVQSKTGVELEQTACSCTCICIEEEE